MRRPAVLVGIAVLVSAVCVRLGLWQLDRRMERRTRNAWIAARRATPPVALGTGRGVEPPADSLWQRRVVVRGTFDWARQRVWAGRTVDGVPGAALLTPLRLADGTTVFVDRGWVPAPDARTVDPAATREADTATVTGLLLRAPRGPGDVDPTRLGDADLRPVVVVWAPDSGRYSASPLPVRRWPAPALDDGPHLGYAIQWFSFAAIALGGAAALLFQGRPRGKKVVSGTS
jgi:surfeit locus 1 family protein